MGENGIRIANEREYKVVKANEIIQRARYDLGILEQKTFCYAVSKIKPGDVPHQWYIFEINDYCEVCGIDRNNGQNIHHIKKTLKHLRDSSFWILNESGEEETVGWFDKVIISAKSGKIKVRFDETIHDYLYNLIYRKPYTQYSLLCVLPMRSAYSIRLYELLKSYSGKGTKRKEFDIDEIKTKLAAPYKNFKDFRNRALEPAIKEINTYTDIEATWEPVKQGRKVVKVTFGIREAKNRILNMHVATKKLDKKIDGVL